MEAHARDLDNIDFARPADPFAPAHQAFEDLLGKLKGPVTLNMRHGTVEQFIQQEGMEVLRQLFQGHIWLRSPGQVEEDVAVVGADGEARTHRIQDMERQLETVFGTVEVPREGYGARGCGSLVPLDADLNLPPEKYSHGVQRRNAEEVQRGSFDAAVSAIDRYTGAHVPKRQSEELAVRASEDFEAFYQTRMVLRPEELAAESSVLAITCDQKGIHLHEEDLLEATRKAAERRKAESESEFSLGLPKPPPAARRDRKRMSTVASVYNIAPYPRTPEQVVGEDGLQVVDKDRPVPEKKRVWASVEKGPEEVLVEAFEEALRRDPKRTQQWVGLSDGNETQLATLAALAQVVGVVLVIILDFIHVAEYVWKAGYALHGRDTKESKRWVRKQLLAILQGRSSVVAAAMRRSATMLELKGTVREAVDKCADYLLKYSDYLRYDDYLAAGLPISTGVIEGACRYLVKDRMEITGAVWRLPDAEAVLKIRSLHASGDWDAYWKFHEHKEYERHHAARYAGDVPPVRKPMIPGASKASHLRLMR